MNATTGATESRWYVSQRSVEARWMALLLLVFTAICPPVVAQGRDYQLEGLDGSRLGPADLGQGVVIAVVWASWSPRGKDVAARTNSIVDRWGSQARIIMVNFQEDKSEAQAFLAGNKTKAKVYLDSNGAFAKRFSVTNLPGLVIFKDGNTVFSGKLPNNPDQLIAQTLG